MKRIGVLFGVENSFPSALVERINARNPAGIQAEFVQTGAVHLNQKPRYAVILDRISHEIPFYRAFLKHAALDGTAVINNPFWCAADDKFFNYALAARLGVAVPPTVLLPHKEYPNGTTAKSLRNLEFPLDWDSVLAAIGEHGFLKPIHGGGWRDVHEVRGREEFFRAYDQSRHLCMVIQKAIEYTEYFRCFVLGAKKVRIMPYEPRRPHAERYLEGAPRARTLRAKRLFRRMEEDALKLCRALGYDLNSVEFAVENGIPYAIDFLNPVPDADVHSVGAVNFEWIVDQVADLAIARANALPRALALRWPEFLRAARSANPHVAKARASTRPKRNARRPISAPLDAPPE
jgi:glutathione synthase/RimK-type ligase-like ATP-grasp enzyme